MPTAVDIIRSNFPDGLPSAKASPKPPQGVNPLVAGYTLIFLVVGWWLYATAGANPRLLVDELSRVRETTGTGRYEIPATDEARTVAVSMREGSSSPPETEFEIGRVEPVKRSVDFRLSDDSTQSRVTDLSCGWVPFHGRGSSTLASPTCIAQPAGVSLTFLANTNADVVLIDPDALPTATSEAYRNQGLVVLSIGFVFAAVLSYQGVREVMGRRRYHAYLRSRADDPNLVPSPVIPDYTLMDERMMDEPFIGDGGRGGRIS